MHASINKVIMVAHLTRDPELRSLPGDRSLCQLRVACNSVRKSGQADEWESKPNFFDVTVWGAQGEACARYLQTGAPVAIDGRLDWREWEAQEGEHRQAVQIIAETIEFLPSRRRAQEKQNGDGKTSTDAQDAGEPSTDFAAQGDEIPF